MRRRPVDFETVCELTAALPGVEEGTAYGSPAVKVGGNMFACLAIHRSAEPDTLAVRIDFDQRDELIAAEPNVYYLTDHYVEYPVVLVRLSKVHRDALRDLLQMGWRFMSAKKNARGRLRKTRKRPTRSATAR